MEFEELFPVINTRAQKRLDSQTNSDVNKYSKAPTSTRTGSAQVADRRVRQLVPPRSLSLFASYTSISSKPLAHDESKFAN